MHAERNPDARIALVAPTAADVRDVMVEGPSGILSICPPWCMPEYEPSKRRLTWPNGARATTFTAEKPRQLRGPQHTAGWCDELAAWSYPDAWDQLQFGLRMGKNPRVVVTTTPRPTQLIKAIAASASTVRTSGTTYDNYENLPPQFFEYIINKYEGSRLGRQEIYADILTDTPGALWKRETLDKFRVRVAPESLAQVIVGVDPAVTSGTSSNETGIIVVATTREGHGYVLADRSLRDTPDTWARRVVQAYIDFDADFVVVETNNGGDLVEQVIRTVEPTIRYKKVHASRGKVARAEPVAALYEQGKIHHVGSFPVLEDQQCTYTPDGYDGSPDRVDALTWALSMALVKAPLSIDYSKMTLPTDGTQTPYRLT